MRVGKRGGERKYTSCTQSKTEKGTTLIYEREKWSMRENKREKQRRESAYPAMRTLK